MIGAAWQWGVAGLVAGIVVEILFRRFVRSWVRWRFYRVRHWIRHESTAARRAAYREELRAAASEYNDAIAKIRDAYGVALEELRASILTDPETFERVGRAAQREADEDREYRDEVKGDA